MKLRSEATVWDSKLTYVGHLRAAPLLPEVLQVERIPSHSTISRFFKRFSQGANQSCFGQFYRWGLEQLSSRKEGYTLDLDTTGLNDAIPSEYFLTQQEAGDGIKISFGGRFLRSIHGRLLMEFGLRETNPAWFAQPIPEGRCLCCKSGVERGDGFPQGREHLLESSVKEQRLLVAHEEMIE